MTERKYHKRHIVLPLTITIINTDPQGCFLVMNALGFTARINNTWKQFM